MIVERDRAAAGLVAPDEVVLEAELVVDDVALVVVVTDDDDDDAPQPLIASAVTRPTPM